uniref:RNA-directed RNA polymerase L n=1 Tax=Rhizoctonia cerealis bunyavirus TaxID=3068840 RepID=A0AA51GH20_9VIRU|nr:MAG: RNA-dependent RNA polymerase [Rhizoctonia cerealis bunyavirus]
MSSAGINFNFKGRSSGKKRAGITNIMKSSRSKNVAGRSRSERKHGKGGNNGKNKKKLQKNSNNVIQNCLKSWKSQEKNKKLKNAFVAIEKPDISAIKSVPIEKKLKPNYRKINQKNYYRRKSEFEEREGRRRVRELQKSMKNDAIREKFPGIPSDHTGTPRMMYCLFLVLRILLQVDFDSKSHYGVHRLCFPHQLSSLGECFMYVLSLNNAYSKKMVELINSDTIVFIRVYGQNHSENHISLQPFLNCNSIKFSQLAEYFSETMFFSEQYTDAENVISCCHPKLVCSLAESFFKLVHPFNPVSGEYISRQHWYNIETSDQILVVREIYYSWKHLIEEYMKKESSPSLAKMLNQGADFDSLMSLSNETVKKLKDVNGGLNGFLLFNKTEFDVIFIQILTEFIEVAKLTQYNEMSKVRSSFKLKQSFTTSQSYSLFRSDFSGFMPEMTKARFLLARTSLTNRPFDQSMLSFKTPESTITAIWVKKVFKKLDLQRDFSLEFYIQDIDTSEMKDKENNEEDNGVDFGSPIPVQKEIYPTESEADRDNEEPNKTFHEIFQMGSDGSIKTKSEVNPEDSPTPILRKVLSHSLSRKPSTTNLKTAKSISSLNSEKQQSYESHSIGSIEVASDVGRINYVSGFDDLDNEPEQQYVEDQTKPFFDYTLDPITESGRRPSLLLTGDEFEPKVVEEPEEVEKDDFISCVNREEELCEIIEQMENRISKRIVSLKNIKNSEFDKIIESRIMDEKEMPDFCRLCKRIRKTKYLAIIGNNQTGSMDKIVICDQCSQLSYCKSNKYFIVLCPVFDFVILNESFIEMSIHHEVTGSDCICRNIMRFHHSSMAGFCNSSKDTREEMSECVKILIDNQSVLDIKANLCQLCEELEICQTVYVLINREVFYSLKICSECFFGFAMEEQGVVMSDNEASLQSYFWSDKNYYYCEECNEKYLSLLGNRNRFGLCDKCNNSKKKSSNMESENYDFIASYNTKSSLDLRPYHEGRAICCFCGKPGYTLRLNEDKKVFYGEFILDFNSCVKCMKRFGFDRECFSIASKDHQRYEVRFKTKQAVDRVLFNNKYKMDCLFKTAECVLCLGPADICCLIETKNQNQQFIKPICLMCCVIGLTKDTNVVIHQTGSLNYETDEMVLDKGEINGKPNRTSLKNAVSKQMMVLINTTEGLIDPDLEHELNMEVEKTPSFAEMSVQEEQFEVLEQQLVQAQSEINECLDWTELNKLAAIKNQIEVLNQKSICLEKLLEDKQHLIKKTNSLTEAFINRANEQTESAHDDEFRILSLEEIIEALKENRMSAGHKSSETLSVNKKAQMTACMFDLAHNLKININVPTMREVNRALRGKKFSQKIFLKYVEKDHPDNHVSIEKFEGSTEILCYLASDYCDIDSLFFSDFVEEPQLSEIDDDFISEFLESNDLYIPCDCLENQIVFTTEDLSWGLLNNKLAQMMMLTKTPLVKSMVLCYLVFLRMAEKVKVMKDKNWIKEVLSGQIFDNFSKSICSGSMRILLNLSFIQIKSNDDLIIAVLEGFEEIEDEIFDTNGTADILLYLNYSNQILENYRDSIMRDFLASESKYKLLIGQSLKQTLYFDTNLLILMSKIENLYRRSFPFTIGFVQTSMNEIINLSKSQPGLNLQFAELLFHNEFEFVRDLHGNLGDEFLAKDLQQIGVRKEAMISLDKLACQKYGWSIMREDEFTSMCSTFTDGRIGPSLSWVRNFGMSAPYLKDERVYIPSLISSNNFLEAHPGNSNLADHLPRIYSLKEPKIIDAVGFEKFSGFRFKDKWLNEIGNKSNFTIYHKSVIEACKNKSNFRFVETRGRQNREFVSSLNPILISKEERVRIESNFEISRATRFSLDKSIIKKTRASLKDSCLPHNLAKIPLMTDSKLIKLLFPKIKFKPYQEGKSAEYNLKVEKTFSLDETFPKMSDWEEPRDTYDFYDIENPEAADLSSLLNQFAMEIEKIELVGNSRLMTEIKNSFQDHYMIHSKLLENYSLMMDHLIHDLINISIPENHAYINSNNFVNFGYIISPGSRNRKVSSKRGVRYYFCVPKNQSTRGFYPDHVKTITVLDEKTNRIVEFDVVFSRFYYVSVDDVIWKSRLYINLSLPRLKSDNSNFVLIFWSLFFAGTNVKKLLAFFKYFNIISLSTFSKLPGLISKYLNICPKREIEWLLLNRVINVVKEVILNNNPITVLGKASNLNDYLELNNLYTLPKPQTTSATHDYQMLYRDISKNINMRDEAVSEEIFEKQWSPKKHININILDFSLRQYEKYSNPTSEKDYWFEIGKNFKSFFITNTNGVDPFSWKKRKNALIFSDVLRDFNSMQPNEPDHENFHSLFLDYCLNKLEKRKAWAFISIKPQKDAADREIVVQEFFTKAGHYAIQSVFRTLCEKWEAELVTKSTHKKYDFISRLPFNQDTIFVNDDMKKWSPHDVKEKFLVLIEMMKHFAIIPDSIFGLLVRSFQLTEKITLLFDERLKDPNVKWCFIEDLIGKNWDEIQSLESQKLKLDTDSKSNSKRLFHPLPMTFGWPQGIFHFISSFYHGLATLYSERVFLDLRIGVTTVNAGFHSDDKNTSITCSKINRDLLWQLATASDVSVRGASLAQSDTKSSITVDKTIMNFDDIAENKRASELVSVYNIEGIITDSYFRQASNLTNSFTHNNLIENHLSAITRACSIFSLSNRIFESEFIYAQLVKYLERFYGPMSEDQIIMLGGVKRAPIFLIAEFGIAADNVLKLTHDPQSVANQISDLIVIKSSKHLSEEGKKFKDKNEAQIHRLLEGGKVSKFLANELKRISTPIAGVFLHERDSNLNNLFRGKNLKLFSTWSQMKSKSVTDSVGNPSSEEAKAEFKTLKEVYKDLTEKNSQLIVNEHLVQSERVYKQILESEFNFSNLIKRISPSITGSIRRAPVTNSIVLSNDFQTATRAVLGGQSVGRDIDVLFSWNSIVEDVANFCNAYNIRGKSEFQKLNSVWDRMRRIGSERNPVMLLWKTQLSFTDCFFEGLEINYDASSNTLNRTLEMLPFSRKYIKIRQGKPTMIKEFNDRATECMNHLIFENRKQLLDGETVNFDKNSQIVSDLFNKYQDIITEVQPIGMVNRMIKSLISKSYIELKNNTFELVGVDEVLDCYIHQMIGNLEIRVVETSNSVFADSNIPTEVHKLIQQRFRGKNLEISNDFVEKLNGDWAPYRVKAGFVNKIDLVSTPAGNMKIVAYITTGRLRPDTISQPCHFKLTKLTHLVNPQAFEEIGLIEKSSTSVRVFKNNDKAPPSVPGRVWSDSRKTVSSESIYKWSRILGTLWNELNVKFCNYSGLDYSSANHGRCKINDGNITICTETGTINSFGFQRITSLFKNLNQKLSQAEQHRSEESEKFRLLNNLFVAVQLKAGKPSSSACWFINDRCGRLCQEDYRWIKSFQSGAGLVMCDNKREDKIGFSFKVMKVLLNDRSAGVLIDNDLMSEFVVPTAISVEDPMSKIFDTVCSMNDQIWSFIRQNKFLIDEEWVVISDEFIDQETDLYKKFMKEQKDLTKLEVEEIIALYDSNEIFINESTKNEITALRNQQLKKKKASEKKFLQNQISNLIVNDYYQSDFRKSKIFSEAIRNESKVVKSKKTLFVVVPKLDIIISKSSTEQKWNSTGDFDIPKTVPLRVVPKIKSKLTTISAVNSHLIPDRVSFLFSKYLNSERMEALTQDSKEKIVNAVVQEISDDELNEKTIFDQLSINKAQAKKLISWIKKEFSNDLPSYSYNYTPEIIHPGSSLKINTEKLPLELEVVSGQMDLEEIAEVKRCMNVNWKNIKPIGKDLFSKIMIIRNDINLVEKLKINQAFDRIIDEKIEHLGIDENYSPESSLGRTLVTGYKTSNSLTTVRVGGLIDFHLSSANLQSRRNAVVSFLVLSSVYDKLSENGKKFVNSLMTCIRNSNKIMNDASLKSHFMTESQIQPIIRDAQDILFCPEEKRTMDYYFINSALTELIGNPDWVKMLVN